MKYLDTRKSLIALEQAALSTPTSTTEIRKINATPALNLFASSKATKSTMRDIVNTANPSAVSLNLFFQVHSFLSLLVIAIKK